MPIKPARILVVEDLEHSRELFKTILEREGHRVDLAGDGKEAVAAAGAHRYDLIIIDIQMPVLGGLEATRIIRTTDKGQSVTIIGMSANTAPDQLRAFEEAGMDDHLRKPFRRAQLLDKIALWLEEASAAGAPNPAAEADPGVKDLVDMFGRDWVSTGLGRLCVQIEEAFGTGGGSDPAVLERQAHAMVSQAALLGFRALSDRASALEDACRRGRGVGEAFAGARDAAMAARDEAERLLSGLG